MGILEAVREENRIAADRARDAQADAQAKQDAKFRVAEMRSWIVAILGVVVSVLIAIGIIHKSESKPSPQHPSIAEPAK